MLVEDLDRFGRRKVALIERSAHSDGQVPDQEDLEQATPNESCSRLQKIPRISRIRSAARGTLQFLAINCCAASCTTRAKNRFLPG